MATPIYEVRFDLEMNTNWTIMKENIYVYHQGRNKIIAVNDIVMLVSYSNYSQIFLCSGEKIFTSKTLKHWSEKIDNRDFLRVHQSFFVNLNFIRELDVKQKRVNLANGLEAVVSRARWRSVKAIILN